MSKKVSEKKKKTTLLISGIIILSLLVGSSFLIIGDSSTKTNHNKPLQEKKKPTPPQDKPLPDQSKNLSYSPPSKPNKEKSPIQKKIKQLVSENEYLLKTNPRLAPIPDEYLGELLEKGYNQAGDIRKLFDWKLAAADLPDLNSTKRIGVIKGLGILINKEEEKNNPFFHFFQEHEGVCHELVVIARKNASIQNAHLIMNIDGRIWAETERLYFQEIIASTLARETDNPNQWEISLLYANGSGPFEGKSGGTALYLALLSSIYKRPLPNNLASSGELAVNQQKVLAIGGLKGKITAAFNQGVRNLVLPWGNSLPDEANLGHFFTESYQSQVPSEIKEQMTVHWVEKMEELKKLLLEGKLS